MPPSRVLEAMTESLKICQMRERCVVHSKKCLLNISLLFMGGCAPQRMPPAEDAAYAYASAINHDDVDTLWNMLSADGRLALNKAELRTLLALNKVELEERARDIQLKPLRTQGRASVSLTTGQRIELTLEDGAFCIDPETLVPAPADSPLKALQLLRSAIIARDYERLRQVLSPEVRQQIDDVLLRLEETTFSPEGALIDTNNDAATVTFPGGTELRLQRIDGHWFVTELL